MNIVKFAMIGNYLFGLLFLYISITSEPYYIKVDAFMLSLLIFILANQFRIMIRQDKLRGE